MRVIGILAIVAITALFAFGVTRATRPTEAELLTSKGHYGFDWSIARDATSEENFRGVIEVRDLDTDAVLWRTVMLSRGGEKTELMQSSGEMSLTASMEVDRVAQRATFQATLSNGQHAIVEQQASVGF